MWLQRKYLHGEEVFVSRFMPSSKTRLCRMQDNQNGLWFDVVANFSRTSFWQGIFRAPLWQLTKYGGMLFSKHILKRVTAMLILGWRQNVPVMRWQFQNIYKMEKERLVCLSPPALPHKRPSSAGTSHDSCHAQGHDKGGSLYFATEFIFEEVLEYNPQLLWIFVI